MWKGLTSTARVAGAGGTLITDLGSQVALVVKNPPANAGDLRDAGLIPVMGRFALEEGVSTHSSILA